MKIGFIGAGNMGGAILFGALESGVLPKDMYGFGNITFEFSNIPQEYASVISCNTTTGEITFQNTNEIQLVKIITINVKIGDVEGLMNICLPYITVEEVIDKLIGLTVEELIIRFGFEWKKEVKAIVNLAKEKYVIRLKENDEPVGLFGIIEETQDVAGIFLLMSEEIKKGNMIHLIRQSKAIVDDWMKDYKALLDDCHFENEKIIRWLMFLGFKPTDEIKDNYFITFQKTA